MKLIVGLGNPGRQYAGNRHNIGAICLSSFARQHRIRLDRKLGHARTGQGEIAGERVVLARPQVFMNLSGKAVKALADRFTVALADIIIIQDDLDLPLAKIRIRLGGSSAGHKGIASIISELGRADFIRLRIGIDRPEKTENGRKAAESEIIDYVLDDFSPEERQVIDRVVPVVGEAIASLIAHGLTDAMNQYN
ncbi:MAG: aminoacyl-tRNA hydrolase [Chloroflexota bacterium]